MTKTQMLSGNVVMRVIALHPCTELEVCRSAPVEDMRHFPSQHYSASTFDLSKSKWARGHSCHVFSFLSVFTLLRSTTLLGSRALKVKTDSVISITRNVCKMTTLIYGVKSSRSTFFPDTVYN